MGGHLGVKTRITVGCTPRLLFVPSFLLLFLPFLLLVFLLFLFYISYFLESRGSSVIEALRYKSEGREFETR
jgi:hypothetical protein